MPFFALKFLSFLPFGNLLRGASGKLILFGGLALLIAFGVWKIRHNIYEKVYNEVYAEQAEEILQQKEREYEKLEELTKIREELTEEHFRSREELIIEIQRIKSMIEYSRPEDDGEVAPVLRDVISHLRSLEERTAKVKEPEKEPSLLDRVLDKVPYIGDETEKSSGNSIIDGWKKKRGQ